MNFFRTLLLSAFFLLFLFLETTAQVPQALDLLFSQTIKNQRNALGVKSLSAAVQFSDGSIWTGTFGVSTSFPLDSVTPSHSYAIGSITKTITAACILQLADEGKLDLDDSLHEWLPTFPYVDSNITVRQLLRHQSGLYDVITNPAYDAATKIDLDSVWTLYNLVNDYTNPPLFAPGTGWSYSNTNYALLGMIIEAASGNSYRSEFSNRFFGPLQLGSLLLPPFDPNPSDIAHLWLYNPNNGSYTDAHSFYVNWNSFRTSAGPIGGYYGTARDIAVWTRAFMRGDLHSQQVLDEAKVTVSTGMPGGTRYGLGLMERQFLGQKAYGHGGDIGYSSFSYYFPEKDMSITVLNNDSKRNSWALAPVVQALLKNCMDYEASVPTDNSLENSSLRIETYPSPFVSEIGVALDLPTDVRSAQIVLSDALGRETARLDAGRLAAGAQKLSIGQLEGLAPGLYFIKVRLDGINLPAVKTMKY